MTWRAALRLGRVSNLPTVWTNVLAGIVLAGATPALSALIPLAVGLSLIYVGGMYLNDAFDRHFDAKERPDRPIPSGEVDAREVFLTGFGLLALGVAIAGAQPFWADVPRPWAPAVSAALLAALVVLYDAWHKGNPLGPVLMGLCRVGIYVTAALSVSPTVGREVLAGSAVLLAYLVGLSALARHESDNGGGGHWSLVLVAAPFVYTAPVVARDVAGAVFYFGFLTWIVWALSHVRPGKRGNIPRAVVSLIAGISLLDALLIARQGRPGLAAAAVAGFALTLLLQRYVRGT